MLFLLLRVETTLTLSLLIILTTLWTNVLKSLWVLGVPVVFIVILGMTYRFIFMLLHTAQDIFESRQSRTVGVLRGAEKRRLAAASVGVLLSKSFQSSEVYLAIQSRGFSGAVDTLDDFEMSTRDWRHGLGRCAVGTTTRAGCCTRQSSAWLWPILSTQVQTSERSQPPLT